MPTAAAVTAVFSCIVASALVFNLSGEQERFRRRDLLHALKNRREQVQQSLKRSQQGDRDALLAGGNTERQQQRAKETEATAELDNHGLVQLQQQIMQQQDHELEQMEKTVVSTKVGACTVAQVLVDAPTGKRRCIGREAMHSTPALAKGYVGIRTGW